MKNWRNLEADIRELNNMLTIISAGGRGTRISSVN